MVLGIENVQSGIHPEKWFTQEQKQLNLYNCMKGKYAELSEYIRSILVASRFRGFLNANELCKVLFVYLFTLKSCLLKYTQKEVKSHDKINPQYGQQMVVTLQS